MLILGKIGESIMQLLRTSLNREEQSDISVGIAEIQECSRYNSSRKRKLPNEVGSLPEICEWPAENINRLVRSPMELGILDVMSFREMSTTSRGVGATRGKVPVSSSKKYRMSARNQQKAKKV